MLGDYFVHVVRAPKALSGGRGLGEGKLNFKGCGTNFPRTTNSKINSRSFFMP
jgi:hypothetical protein